jgi:DNA-binding transcriptional regulator WhiA
MKKLLWLLTLFAVVMLSSCEMESVREFKYNTNQEQYTNDRVNWFTQGNWGNSLDGSFIMVGTYDYTDNSISLTEKKASPASFDQAFYTLGGTKENYIVEGVFSINSMVVREGIYNKFGFYAAYQDPNNYAHVFLHPLENEHFISVSAIVDGNWELIWKIYEIPSTIDFSDSVKLTIMKIDNEFRMFVDDHFIGAFYANIEEAQIGVLSEEMTYTINQFVFDDLENFPRTTEGFGESLDMETPVMGDYDIVAGSATIYGDVNAAQIFSEQTYENFLIKSKLVFSKYNLSEVNHFGFYLMYLNKDNYAKLYFENSLDMLIYEEVVDGVSTLITFNTEGLLPNDVIHIYKIEQTFKVYVHDEVKAEGSISILEGQIGFYSKNTNGTYQEFTILNAQAFPVSNWGNSYDGVISLRGTYTWIDGTLTLLSTESGGYGSMEQMFYQEAPEVDFTASAVMYHAQETINNNNKYGFMFYHDVNNYLEIFIIPNLNAIFAVSKINGVFGFLWTKLYDFEEGIDHRVAGDALVVTKEAGTFNIYLGETLIYNFTRAEFAELAMQVALVSEKTTPVIFEDFMFQPFETEILLWGNSYDDALNLRGTYTWIDGTLTLLSTESGGYASMEQMFYQEAPEVDFTASAVMYHAQETINNNNKYGFRFYHDVNNYLEIFIIPNLNAIFAVSKINGVFGFLWTKLYDFEEGTDHRVAGDALVVTKEAGTFNIYLGETLVYNFTRAEFAELAMQVALISEKTAPVIFEDFMFQPLETEILIWGNSYDDVLNLRGTYTWIDGTLTLLSTELGGYVSMEQMFYQKAPEVDFTASAVMYHTQETINNNNKYGFRFYHDVNNYLEIFIIPNLNAIFAVSKIDGVFGFLWTKLYDFEEGTDHRVAGDALVVTKEAGTFNIYLGETLVYNFTRAEFAELAMQVALISEKTAPVIFEDFMFQPLETEILIWGNSYDGVISLRGTYTWIDGTLTLLSTELGGYVSMEQMFYQKAPEVDFTASAVMYHTQETINNNNKYGFRFYHDVNNYLEIFIIPNLNAIFAVSKIDGVFGFLWTKLYDFEEGTDHRVAGDALVVTKAAGTFNIYLGETLVYNFTRAEFAELAMQVALVSEKTAPVIFEEFDFSGN